MLRNVTAPLDFKSAALNQSRISSNSGSTDETASSYAATTRSERRSVINS
jgi:hypothetical protein